MIALELIPIPTEAGKLIGITTFQDQVFIACESALYRLIRTENPDSLAYSINPVEFTLAPEK